MELVDYNDKRRLIYTGLGMRPIYNGSGMRLIYTGSGMRLIYTGSEMQANLYQFLICNGLGMRLIFILVHNLYWFRMRLYQQECITIPASPSKRITRASLSLSTGASTIFEHELVNNCSVEERKIYKNKKHRYTKVYKDIQRYN